MFSSAWMAPSSMPGSACDFGRRDLFGCAVRGIGRSSSEEREIGELWFVTATRFDADVDMWDVAGGGIFLPGDELADLRVIRKSDTRQRVAERADDFVDVGRLDVIDDPS